MSETPMNKLRELCEKWQLPNINIRGDGGEGSTDISYSATRLQCAAELRAILPDVERLEQDREFHEACYLKSQENLGEMTGQAARLTCYAVTLQEHVERLVEALRLACNFLPVGSEACLYCDNLGEEHAPNCVTVVIRSALALFAHPVAPKEKP